nr:MULTISPECIES: hypothetical protein [Wolbachia]
MKERIRTIIAEVSEEMGIKIENGVYHQIIYIYS